MSHQKMCTADNPMTKGNKETSYASRAGAKVSYPKLKQKEKAHESDNNNHTEVPSKEKIIDLISNSKCFEDPTICAQFHDILLTFLSKNSK